MEFAFASLLHLTKGLEFGLICRLIRCVSRDLAPQLFTMAYHTSSSGSTTLHGASLNTPVASSAAGGSEDAKESPGGPTEMSGESDRANALVHAGRNFAQVARRDSLVSRGVFSPHQGGHSSYGQNLRRPSTAFQQSPSFTANAYQPVPYAGNMIGYGNQRPVPNGHVSFPPPHPKKKALNPLSQSRH